MLIYEDVLSNNTVSIYAREKDSMFLRKLVESKASVSEGNSTDLKNCPDLTDYINSDKLFVKKTFIEGYLAFCLTMS